MWSSYSGTKKGPQNDDMWYAEKGEREGVGSTRVLTARRQNVGAVAFTFVFVSEVSRNE